MDTLTIAQFRAAVALAAAYGHTWGALATAPLATREEDVVACCYACLDAGGCIDGHGQCYGGHRLARERDAGRLVCGPQYTDGGWTATVLRVADPERLRDWDRLQAAIASGAVPVDLIGEIARPYAGSFGLGWICPIMDDAGRVVHITGTRRLSWAVDRHGSACIEISRPSGVVLRAEVARGRALPHVRVDVVRGATFHFEHVDSLIGALRAAGADQRGCAVACQRAYDLALPDRPGRCAFAASPRLTVRSLIDGGAGWQTALSIARRRDGGRR